MFDRLTSSKRPVWTTFAATGALFLVLVVLLGVQMALGRDPSIGDRTGGRGTQGAQSRPQQLPQQQQGGGWGDDRGYERGYGDGGYDDGQYDGGPGYDDGYGGGYDQQQQVPQQGQGRQQGPPMQSGTS